MGRMVESDGVQLIEVGSSGKNYCLTLSKNALIAIREGKSFPIEVLEGGAKKTIVVMRDNVYKQKMKLHNKIAEQAKEQVQDQIAIEKEVNEVNKGLDLV